MEKLKKKKVKKMNLRWGFYHSRWGKNNETCTSFS